MKDYRASIEKLRSDAAEAALIRDLASDPVKRDIFDNLHKHLVRLAEEVERALRAAPRSPSKSIGPFRPVTGSLHSA